MSDRSSFGTPPARSSEIRSLLDDAARKIESQDDLRHEQRIGLREDLKRIRSLLSSPEPFKGARALAVHPRDPGTLFLGTEAGLFRSTDGASNWSRVESSLNGLQIWSIAISPHDPNLIVVGTCPSRLFRSEDGGRTWSEPAVKMLRDCLEYAGSEAWLAPVGKFPFWHVAYHALFVTDLYLSPEEATFQPHAVENPHYAERFLPLYAQLGAQFGRGMYVRPGGGVALQSGSIVPVVGVAIGREHRFRGKYLTGAEFVIRASGSHGLAGWIAGLQVPIGLRPPTNERAGLATLVRN